MSTKTFELKVEHRLLMLMLMPEKADFSKMRTSKDLMAKLEFSQAEVKALKLLMKEENGKMVYDWDGKKDKAKKIILTELELEIIQMGLVNLSNLNELTRAHFALVELLKLDEKMFEKQP